MYVYVCMSVYALCICMHVRTHAYVHASAFAYVHANTYTCTCMQPCMHICKHLRAHHANVHRTNRALLRHDRSLLPYDRPLLKLMHTKITPSTYLQSCLLVSSFHLLGQTSDTLLCTGLIGLLCGMIGLFCHETGLFVNLRIPQAVIARCNKILDGLNPKS